MSAHLAGVVGAATDLPVIGVPIDSSSLGGLDSLLSTVQMPPGIPVATMGIGGRGSQERGPSRHPDTRPDRPETGEGIPAFRATTNREGSGCGCCAPERKSPSSNPNAKGGFGTNQRRPQKKIKAKTKPPEKNVPEKIDGEQNSRGKPRLTGKKKSFDRPAKN